MPCATSTTRFLVSCSRKGRHKKRNEREKQGCHHGETSDTKSGRSREIHDNPGVNLPPTAAGPNAASFHEAYLKRVADR